MDAREVLRYHQAHWRRPWAWGLVAGWLVVWLLRGDIVKSALDAPGLWERLLSLVSQGLPYGAIVLLSPAPWLWSGRHGDFPRFPRALLQMVPSGLVIITLLSIVDSAKGVLFGAAFGPEVLANLKMNAAVFLFFYGLVGFGLSSIEKEVLARQEAEKRAMEAQWILLRGQLSPHVLFNGMNNLARLIKKDADRAEQAAEDMSELFRRLMDHAHRHLSPLKEERKLVEHYLAMESLRLGERLRVEWAWDLVLDDVEAPPFLLQPLVENALKHGLSPCPEGGTLRIEGILQHDRVHLRVVNTGRPFTGRHGSGLGLRNLESRLDLAFDGDGVFTLALLENRTVASLDIPCLKELP